MPQEEQSPANTVRVATGDMPGPSSVAPAVRIADGQLQDLSSTQAAPTTDPELHTDPELNSAAAIAAALQDHLSKPYVYRELGYSAPPPIPVSAAEAWLTSAWIVARSSQD